jgi:hypothetical protein
MWKEGIEAVGGLALCSVQLKPPKKIKKGRERQKQAFAFIEFMHVYWSKPYCSTYSIRY